MADDNQPVERKLLPDQAFEELTDVTTPIQLKKLNDELRLLHLLLGYGRTPTGNWYAGGTAGSGVDINGDDINLTVKNIWMAAHDEGGDASLVISDDSSGLPNLNAIGTMRMNGRRLVLPPGEWVMHVTSTAPYTYGNPLRVGVTYRDPNDNPVNDPKNHYKSLYAAVRDVPLILMGNLTIIVNSQTADADYEPVALTGITGDGALTIRHASSGRIRAAVLVADGCAVPLVIGNMDVLATNINNIWWPDKNGNDTGYTETASVAVRWASLRMSNCRIAGLTAEGVVVYDGGSLYANSCTTRYGNFAYLAEGNGRIVLVNCAGGQNHVNAGKAERGGMIAGIGTVPQATNPWRAPYSDVVMGFPIVPQMSVPTTPGGLPTPDAAYVLAVNNITTNINAYIVQGINDAIGQLVEATEDNINKAGRLANNATATEGLVLGNPTASSTGAGSVPVSVAITKQKYFATKMGTYAGVYLPDVSDAQQGKAMNGREAIGLMWFGTVTLPGNLKSVRLTMTRAPHRGAPGPVPIQITGFLASSEKTDTPRRVKDYGTVGLFSWGETRSVALPVAVAADLADGTVTALGVYYGEKNEAAMLGLAPTVPTLEFWSY